MSLEIQQKFFSFFRSNVRRLTYIFIYMNFFTNAFLDNNITGIELDSLSAFFGLQSLSLLEITQDNRYFTCSRMEERVRNTDVRYCL
jgi:hypothetical protein